MIAHTMQQKHGMPVTKNARSVQCGTDLKENKMKKSITPHDIDELKDFFERSNLEAEIEKFTLSVESPPGKQFGLDSPETYTITVKFTCTQKDD